MHCVHAEGAVSIAPIKLSSDLSYICGNSIHGPVKHVKTILLVSKHRESNHVLVLANQS
jgi:hypothetical protein